MPCTHPCVVGAHPLPQPHSAPPLAIVNFCAATCRGSVIGLFHLFIILHIPMPQSKLKLLHSGKSAEKRLRTLPLHTSHFHNLTDLLRAHLGGSTVAHGDSQPRMQLQRLPGQAAPRQTNLAVWQLTGELPLTLDFVFLGGAIDAAGVCSSLLSGA